MAQKDGNKKVIIITSLTGFFWFLLNDISYYISNKYDVYCVANNTANEDIVNSIKKMGCHFIHVNFDSKRPLSIDNLVSYFELKKIFKKYNFDILHCHTPIVAVLSRLASKKFRKKGLKVLYTSHGLAFNSLSSKKSKLIYGTIERCLAKYTDGIISINHEDYDFFRKECKTNTYYLPGVGVDISKYRIARKTCLRDELGIPVNDIVILCIGELSVRKNHISVVKAINKSKFKQNIHLIILGKSITDNSIKSDIVQYSNENSISVVFPGHVSNVADYISVCDFGCLPSLREGLGLAGIETLAGGKPVIGSDVQGIKDYIINDYTGMLFNPYSIESITNSIDYMIINLSKFSPENCVSMARNFSKEKSENELRIILNNYI